MKLDNIRPLSQAKLRETRGWLGEIVKTRATALREHALLNSDDFIYDCNALSSHGVILEIMRKR